MKKKQKLAIYSVEFILPPGMSRKKLNRFVDALIAVCELDGVRIGVSLHLFPKTVRPASDGKGGRRVAPKKH